MNARGPQSSDASVRFGLDGAIVVLDNPDPTRTVLQWLREERGRTGTKEGCAEGDCGACTVVVGERVAGRVRFRAVNACIHLLPFLDGKELFTVESLKRADGGLHPVQRAMVECHASQCGFCTPGFVMSLFALYKSARAPARQDIEDALAGNLCRCTGYRPIVAAAQAMYEQGREAATPDAHWMNCSFASAADVEIDAGERAMIERLESIARHRTLALDRDGHRYFAPVTLDALADLVAGHPDARIVAGATDVGLWITKKLVELPTVIATTGVAELKRIDVRGDVIDIGAAVPLADAFAALVAEYPDLDELARRFASPPIRNAGTLGGNIANGSPIGDSMPALIALDARLVLRAGARTRELPLDAFYLAYQKTALERGEFVERIVVPRAARNAIVRSYKVSKRFDQDISAVCGGYRIVVDGGMVRDARIAYGGVAATPRRAPGAERALLGRPWSEATIRDAMAALDRDYTPLSDMRASADYRRSVTRNLLYRLWLETGGGAAAATRVPLAPEAAA